MMATHNCVTRAGTDCFLELIAIDPDDRPTRPDGSRSMNR